MKYILIILLITTHTVNAQRYVNTMTKAEAKQFVRLAMGLTDEDYPMEVKEFKNEGWIVRFTVVETHYQTPYRFSIDNYGNVFSKEGLYYQVPCMKWLQRKFTIKNHTHGNSRKN